MENHSFIIIKDIEEVNDWLHGQGLVNSYIVQLDNVFVLYDRVKTKTEDIESGEVTYGDRDKLVYMSRCLPKLLKKIMAHKADLVTQEIDRVYTEYSPSEDVVVMGEVTEDIGYLGNIELQALPEEEQKTGKLQKDSFGLNNFDFEDDSLDTPDNIFDEEEQAKYRKTLYRILTAFNITGELREKIIVTVLESMKMGSEWYDIDLVKEYLEESSETPYVKMEWEKEKVYVGDAALIYSASGLYSWMASLGMKDILKLSEKWDKIRIGDTWHYLDSQLGEGDNLYISNDDGRDDCFDTIDDIIFGVDQVNEKNLRTCVEALYKVIDMEESEINKPIVTHRKVGEALGQLQSEIQEKEQVIESLCLFEKGNKERIKKLENIVVQLVEMLGSAKDCQLSAVLKPMLDLADIKTTGE